MQSQVTRQTARLAQRCQRSIPARRTYAQQAPETKARASQPDSVNQGRQNRIPTIALVSVGVALPAFYFLQGVVGTGNKAPGSGQAEIKQARRENGTANEYRDPRDSGKKTSSVDGPGK